MAAPSPLVSLMSRLSVISLLDTYEIWLTILIGVQVFGGANEVTTCGRRSGDTIDNFFIIELYSDGRISVISEVARERVLDNILVMRMAA